MMQQFKIPVRVKMGWLYLVNKYLNGLEFHDKLLGKKSVFKKRGI